MKAEGGHPGLVVARVAGALALVAATLTILRPFLVPMAWAAIGAYITWPLYRRARDWTGRPGLIATLFTFLMALGVGFPVAWALVALAQEATHLVNLVREWVAAGLPFPEWITSRPWAQEAIQDLREASVLDAGAVGELVSRYGAPASARLVEVAGGIARNLFQFSVAMVTLYVFYLDGERLVGHARRLAPLFFPSARKEIIADIGAVVQAVVFGLLGTGIAQGIMMATGLAIAGVPSPVFLGVLTVMASFIPFGPPLIWGGAALWTGLNGERGWALFLVLWGILLVSSLDNVLRPLLISGPTRIPFLLVFFGVLGGLASLGMLGIFVGPVLLSVAFTLLAELPRMYGAAGAARPRR
jgi:predicted PurR-regulated permease PerM